MYMYSTLYRYQSICYYDVARNLEMLIYIVHDVYPEFSYDFLPRLTDFTHVLAIYLSSSGVQRAVSAGVMFFTRSQNGFSNFWNRLSRMPLRCVFLFPLLEGLEDETNGRDKRSTSGQLMEGTNKALGPTHSQ